MNDRVTSFNRFVGLNGVRQVPDDEVKRIPRDSSRRCGGMNEGSRVYAFACVEHLT
jgi:hypothetical protein